MLVGVDKATPATVFRSLADQHGKLRTALQQAVDMITAPEKSPLSEADVLATVVAWRALLAGVATQDEATEISAEHESLLGD